MKVLVFGSSGGVGSEVVRQALDMGHNVTAVARRPEAVTLKHPCLEIVQGDVLAAESLQSQFAGQDAVVSALGVHDRAPTTLYSQGASNIIAGMLIYRAEPRSPAPTQSITSSAT